MDKKRFAIKQLNLFLQQHEEKKIFFQTKYQQLYKQNGFTFYNYVKYYLNDNVDRFCIMCGKRLTYRQIFSKTTHCSKKCLLNDKSYRQFHKNMVNEFWHSQIGKQTKEKIIKTNLEKYGVENVFQNQQIKDKIKQTNLEKYGVQNPFANQQIKDKIKQTNLEKYGVQCVGTSPIIRQKIENTNMKKYGKKSTLQVDFVKEKIALTNLQRYGSENYFSSNPMRFQIFQNMVQRVIDYVVPMFNFEDYTVFAHTMYPWKCVKCGCQFQDFVTQRLHYGQTLSIPKCPNCYGQANVSGLEKETRDFLQTILKNNDIVFSDKKIISPYQLDIYIPQKNIAIQFDGIFWHSDYKIKDKKYHFIKTQMCKEKGIQLVHIFEDEWVDKQDIVKDRIKNILGIYDNRIFARKCIIKQIPFNICNQFLDANHIQGHDNSKIRLGLFYNDQLVSVMTFSKPRFNKNYEYELVRFASKLGYQVIGGASKLLKYFQRKYNPKNIISYADRRYSNGKLYYTLGFEFLNNSEPNYWWSRNKRRYSRYQCQKHKLKNILCTVLYHLFRVKVSF